MKNTFYTISYEQVLLKTEEKGFFKRNLTTNMLISNAWLF